MATRNDYAQQRFSRIVLESPVPDKPGYWQGHCDCGNTVQKRPDNLKRPGDHSCGRCRAPVPAASPDNPGSDPDVIARLTALEVQNSQLRHELADLKERLASTQPAPPSRDAITSSEGRQIWDHIDAMKSWLKDEIGARLRALEEQTARLNPLVEPISAHEKKLAQNNAELEAVGQEVERLKNLVLTSTSDQAECPTSNPPRSPAHRSQPEPVLHNSADQPRVARNGQGHENSADVPVPATTPPAKKIYPIREGHILARRFYYTETPEGFDLETTFDRKCESLGFFDTVAEVERAIEDYLYGKNCMPQIIEDLFTKASCGTGDLADNK